MILAETALSFLGIGLQPPIISWGVLLQEAQNIRAVAQAPWLLFTPAAAIVIAVLPSISLAMACVMPQTHTSRCDDHDK